MWRMRAAITTSALLLSCLTLEAQSALFRSEVEIVPLTVTVTDATGRYTTGLDATDFAVFEDGVPQRVSLFTGGRLPLDVAFVVDTSSSVAADLPVIKQAVHGVLRELTEGDRVSIIAFNSSVDMPLPLSDDRAHVAATIDGLRADGATALFDGVYVALTEFARAQNNATKMRRRVLILLSDGIDTASHVTYETTVDLARQLDINIYTITLTDPTTNLPKALNSAKRLQARYAMRALATELGGRAFFPSAGSELPAIYAAIANELAFQYVLGYTPAKPADGQFRRVSVRSVPPLNVTARTRSGYLAAVKPPAIARDTARKGED